MWGFVLICFLIQSLKAYCLYHHIIAAFIYSLRGIIKKNQCFPTHSDHCFFHVLGELLWKMTGGGGSNIQPPLPPFPESPATPWIATQQSFSCCKPINKNDVIYQVLHRQVGIAATNPLRYVHKRECSRIVQVQFWHFNDSSQLEVVFSRVLERTLKQTCGSAASSLCKWRTFANFPPFCLRLYDCPQSRKAMAKSFHFRGRESILFASTHAQKLKTGSMEVFPGLAESIWSDSSTVHITLEASASWRLPLTTPKDEMRLSQSDNPFSISVTRYLKASKPKGWYLISKFPSAEHQPTAWATPAEPSWGTDNWDSPLHGTHLIPPPKHHQDGISGLEARLQIPQINTNTPLLSTEASG